MKLSVIIPVYNAESYLAECLDSVLTQSFPNLEVVCVDDASTDRSAEILEEYRQRDPRVRWFRNETNQYAGACRNRGIEAARGEFLHFMDADDLAVPGIYEKILPLAEKFDADVVKGTGRGFCRTGDGETEWLSAGPLLELREIAEKDLEKPFTFDEHAELLSHVSVVPWNGIYRASVVKEHQIRFNGLVCVNDRSFYNEVTLAAKKIVLTRECFVYYRVNQGSSLMGRRAKNFNCEFRSYEIVKEQLAQYGASPENCRIVLKRELADIFLWYRRYHKLPEGVGVKVTEETRSFAKQLDLGELRGMEKQESWYRTYRYLSGKETEMEKIARVAAGVKRRVQRSLKKK